MTNLAFRDVTFTPVTINHIIYITSAQLAEALGYVRPEAVTKIYNRNKDEFSADMSRLPNLGNTANLKAERRVFSLRGAHLIAMFSRTPIAKEFRKWVLDILDKESCQQSAPTNPEADFTNSEALTAAREAALKYFTDYRAAIQNGGDLPTFDVPVDILVGLLAGSLWRHRFLLSFDNGRMDIRHIPDDASIIRVNNIPDLIKDPYYQFTQDELMSIINAAAMRLSKASAPAPVIPPAEPKSPRKQWKNIRLVERMLKSMRIKQEYMYGTTVVSPREVERLHRIGVIGDRQIVRLRKEMV